MAAKTAKEAILDALEDLEKTDLEKFCNALRDRREEPRIRRSTIENKSRTEIADKLVTTFTEDNAVEVTLNILKKIDCNDVAQELHNWREKAVDLMDQPKIPPITPEKAVDLTDQLKIPSITLEQLKSDKSLQDNWRKHPIQRKFSLPPLRALSRMMDNRSLSLNDFEGISPGLKVETYDPKRMILTSILKSLKDNSNKCKEFEQTYKDVCQHNKKQVVTTEKQIRADIEKLHQSLREVEEERVSALKEEEKQKAEIVTREMKNIQEQFSSLSDQISDIEQVLQKPNVSILRDQCTLSEPQLVSGVLIDVTKHLGNLTYTVWEKIKEKVTFSPVILDPNTANGYLSLSEDLTSVRDSETKQKLPDNPERFTMYPSVLGSEGFSSGTHTWEVEVGDHPRWNIGYVTNSVDRKGERSTSPGDGIWCLRRHRSMEYSNGEEYFSLQRNPQRIRVQLDYDKGEVSFYDTEDMTQICTHEDTFTEKLYPYLNYEKASDAETTAIRICQVAQGCPTCGSD